MCQSQKFSQQLGSSRNLRRRQISLDRSCCSRIIPTKIVRKVVRSVKDTPRTKRKDIKRQFTEDCIDVIVLALSNMMHPVELRKLRPRKYLC